MQKRLLLTNIILMGLLMLAACKGDTFTASSDMAAPPGVQLAAVGQGDSSMRQSPTPAVTDDRLCAHPAPALEQTCGALERQILASVVRLEVRGPDPNDSDRWAGGAGHGTIMDGRFLVTHNHFSVPLSTLNNVKTAGAAAVSLYKANGERIMLEAPPTVFRVVVEDPEILVLDFGTNDAGQGFFDMLGMPSAEFRAWKDLQLQQGMEVAQIDWDGSTAHVDWVHISGYNTEDGTPTLELDNSVARGASGGGIFWQGYHIANNWATVTILDEAGSVVRQFSRTALNSLQAVAPVAMPVVAQPILAGTVPTAAQDTAEG